MNEEKVKALCKKYGFDEETARKILAPLSEEQIIQNLKRKFLGKIE